MGRLRKTAHATYTTYYHIVWIPKYRNPILTEPIQKRLKEILVGIGERYDCPIDTLEVEKDRIHIFCIIPPTISISTAVQYFKGISSKLLRQEFPEIDKVLWGAELWAIGYFVSTVNDRTTSQIIRKYIENQKRDQYQLKLF